jgi:hypothetical protein
MAVPWHKGRLEAKRHTAPGLFPERLDARRMGARWTMNRYERRTLSLQFSTLNEISNLKSSIPNDPSIED